MASITLAQLRELARQRADQEYVAGVSEANKFVTDSELNGYINRSIEELYDLIISCYGNDYYADQYPITLTADEDTYALPTAFYQLLGVDLVITSDQRYSLKPFMFQERNDFRNYPANTYQGPAYRYHLRGNNIVFQPTPTAGNNAVIWYIPLAVVLTSDSDTMQGFNGWEEYVIIDAAIKMAIKQEDDITNLKQAKNDMIVRIKTMADNRDSGFPQRVQDVDGYSEWGNRRWY